LVNLCPESGALHLFDFHAIRDLLVTMGLDWDALSIASASSPVTDALTLHRRIETLPPTGEKSA
jgi:hypothetical protein